MPAILTILTDAHLRGYAADRLDADARRMVEIAAAEDPRIARRLADLLKGRTGPAPRRTATAPLT